MNKKSTNSAARWSAARKWRAGLAGLLLAAGTAAGARAGIVPTRELESENGHQYVLVGSRVTWAAASESARRRGGHLVTITSRQEQRLVERLFRDANAPSGAYWFGVRKGDDGNFENVTGERLRYTNWLNGQPDNFGGNETRGSILWTIGGRETAARRGLWNDLPEGKGYPQLAASSPDMVVRGFVIEIGDVGSDGGDGDGGSGVGAPGNGGNETPGAGTPGTGTPGTGTPGATPGDGAGTPGGNDTGGGTPGGSTPGNGNTGGVTPGTVTPGTGTPGGTPPGGGTDPVPGDGTDGNGTPGSGIPGSGIPGPGDGTGTPPDGTDGGTGTPGDGATGGGPGESPNAIPLPTALYLFPSGLLVAAYAARRMYRRR